MLTPTRCIGITTPGDSQGKQQGVWTCFMIFSEQIDANIAFLLPSRILAACHCLPAACLLLAAPCCCLPAAAYLLLLTCCPPAAHLLLTCCLHDACLLLACCCCALLLLAAACCCFFLPAACCCLPAAVPWWFFFPDVTSHYLMWLFCIAAVPWGWCAFSRLMWLKYGARMCLT